MKISKTKICLVALLALLPNAGHSVPDYNYWKGAVCAALISGNRADHAESTDYERAVADFRMSLKPFAPDIRQDTTEILLGNEETDTKNYIRFYNANTPALQEFQIHRAGPPTDQQSLAMAQRAYGIEYDLVKKENASFTFGYAIKGRTAILQHLRQIEASIDDHAAHTRRFVRSKIPIWRPANLIAVMLSGVLGYRASIGYLPGLILIYPLLKNEVGYYLSNLLGQFRRTHLNGYHKHLDFIKDELQADPKTLASHAYYAANVRLSPSLIEVFKKDQADSARLNNELETQARVDRRAWFENLIEHIRANGLQIVLPLGTEQSTASIDNLFYYDEYGEPVYVFSTRFLNDRPQYPKKRRESREWFHEVNWQKAGA